MVNDHTDRKSGAYKQRKHIHGNSDVVIHASLPYHRDKQQGDNKPRECPGHSRRMGKVHCVHPQLLSPLVIRIIRSTERE